MNPVIISAVLALAIFIILIAVVVMAIYILRYINSANAATGCAGNTDLGSAHTWTAWVIGLGITALVGCAVLGASLLAYNHREKIVHHAKKGYAAYRSYDDKDQ